MEKKKRRRREACPDYGDIRKEQEDRRQAQEQPLSQKEKDLVNRAYDLFDFFSAKLREEHDEMREARRMRQMRYDGRSRTSPMQSTLGSCCDNVIADQMDNMPEAVLVPEREETARSAEEMSDVVSYVLYQVGWPGKYQTLMEDAIVTGTGVAQVYWDDELEAGEGMASVMSWHPEDFYPDPLYENIQDGRGCFKVTHTSVAWVEEHYPEARGYVQAEPVREDGMDMELPAGDSGCMLLEFWYKRYDAQEKRTRVHMALLAGHALLFSTESGLGTERGEEEYQNGVYAHGQYPFVLYKYRDVWKKPFGTGLMHDYADMQKTIDRYCKYVDDNARASSLPRHFIRKGSGVNADEVADMSRSIIEWEGTDIREVMQTVQTQPLNPQVYEMMRYMTDMMKQDCGQNHFGRGEGGLGVTAGIAIRSLQDAGSKITRWHSEKFKEAFRGMIEQLLWVLSEYMEPGRKLRIIGGWESGGNMRERLIELIAPGETDGRMPKPAYTVRVQTQKGSPEQIERDNEFLMKAAEISAQYGTPLPPTAIIRLMEGFRTKGSVLRAVEEAQNAGES